MMKTKRYKFIPDKELLVFAKDFSENYLTQKCDTYYSGNSGNGKYVIEYLEHNESRDKRNFSVGMSSGNMVFSKNELIKYSKNFVFYMILWMKAHKDVIDNRNDERNIFEETDKHALKFYLTTKRSKRDVFTGFSQLYTSTPTELNLRRQKNYNKFLVKK